MTVKLNAVHSCFNLNYGHAAILETSRHIFLNIRFLSDRTLKVYPDDSKMSVRMGCGIFIKGSNIKLSYRLPEHCSIYKTECLF